MLYLTTRDQKDAHTAHRTLLSDYAADGGIYLPFQIRCYNKDQRRQLTDRSFGENVAQILNYFFSAQLTGWGVDFAIGRNPMKVAVLGRKIMTAELWHNHDSNYSAVEKNLFRILSNSIEIASTPTEWAKVAIRIAILFGVYGDLLRNGTITASQDFDVVAESGGFFDPIAVLYAKKMGLPIRRVIVCANTNNSSVWDLIHRYEVSTTLLPEQLKSGIERFLYLVYGEEELSSFISACENRRIYEFNPETEIKHLEEVFCVVVSDDRIPGVVSSVARTDNYHIDHKTARAFGAIQDFRAKVGESYLTLVLSESKP